jgi:ABC-type transport system involved in multi-copper enzyme maturation permease subunit
MVLGLGPVVRYELITTARRGRYYLARLVYGFSLLFLLWNEFSSFAAQFPGGGTVEQVREFAESTFIQFAAAQGVALLCLIPVLTAGVIADEHQRKTLHFLLASRLSSVEIVWGKLAARMVHVGTYVALGIPVVCLVALYGGLNPENVYYVYLGTFTTVMFVSGVSILVSIVARRPRDAILVAYGLVGAWLLVPIWIRPLSEYLDGPLWWVQPVNECVMLTNPAFIWGQATNQAVVWRGGVLRPGWFMGQFTWQFYWMVGLQAGLGLLFMGLAVAGLRPLRGSSWPGGKPAVGWWSRLTTNARAIVNARAAAALTRNQILTALSDRAACGDDPMLWKERHTPFGGGLRWLGSRPMVLFFAVLLGCYLLDVCYPLLIDLASGNWRSAQRPAVNDALRGSSMVMAFLGMLGVAAASAVSITGECEQDTWISLLTTLLTPAEIIRAKQLGAVWSARRVGFALALMWAAGILLGAIHPLGALAAALYACLIAWLIAAFGVFVSSRAKNSTRALVATFIVFLAFSALGRWPLLVWNTLVSYRDVSVAWSQPATGINVASLGFPPLVAIFPHMAVYAFGAAILTLAAQRSLSKTSR